MEAVPPYNPEEGPHPPNDSVIFRGRQMPPSSYTQYPSPVSTPLPGRPWGLPLQPPTTPVLRPYQPPGSFRPLSHYHAPAPPRETRAMEDERDGWSPDRYTPRLPADDNKTSPALDMSFLDWFPKGNVTISYPNASGAIQRIHGIHRGILADRSALLSSALDGNGLHLEAVSHLTIKPFLQFVYTGMYILPTPSGEPFEDVPTSLLVHCHMYRLGDIYSMPDLKKQGYANIVRQCEYGCSSPDAPIHLCQAIEFVYTNMRQHADVIETIVAYCVSCFSQHRLATSFDFRRIAYDLRPFHQDLCKVSMERHFEDDDTAQAIIQMPFEPYSPAAYASRNDDRAQQVFDDVYHFRGDDRLDNSHKRRPSDGGCRGDVEISGRAARLMLFEGSIADSSSFMPQDRVENSAPTGPSRSGMHTLALLQRKHVREPSRETAPAPRVAPTMDGTDGVKPTLHLSLRPASQAHTRHTMQTRKTAGKYMEPKTHVSSSSMPPKMESSKPQPPKMEPPQTESVPLAPKTKCETPRSSKRSGPPPPRSVVVEAVVAQAAQSPNTQEQVTEEEQVQEEDFDEYKVVPSPVKTFASDTELDDDFVKIDLNPTKLATNAEKLRPGSPYFNINDPENWPDAASNSEDSEWDLV
ncbi:hypothetical protein CERZMDRAFT_101762 [Cercospora zeae-maydis SCOH1-5]|uniref:BTB domain-containing protein n=1 Tax=Cercospora zeae-maydis SCOH1-5 TaxID=717836 RepID=A0A6A6F287_9PEZI|nr:hypothetical protein CERZMDRAFT_101762 [Cercospora zeae-maydis SCOH1-5]